MYFDKKTILNLYSMLMFMSSTLQLIIILLLLDWAESSDTYNENMTRSVFFKIVFIKKFRKHKIQIFIQLHISQPHQIQTLYIIVNCK